MANSRVISSAIWEDEWFGPLGFFEQVLWIGLWSKCADDQGRLLDNPILIRAAIFPYKDVPTETISAALAQFECAGRVHRYQADGKHLLQVVHWWTHQSQQWASASRWPAPAGWTDHVRTRENGQYVTVNWRSKAENAQENAAWTPQVTTPGDGVQVNPSPEQCTCSPQAGGHIPIPIPIPVPVPVPGRENVDKPAKPAAKAKRRSRADPRTDTPAIACVRGVMGGATNPPIVLYDEIIETLGETPDGPRLARCYQEWVKRGFKPTNYAWLFDWYVRGIPENGSGGARASPSGSGNGKNAYFNDPEVYARAGREWDATK